MAPVLCFLNAEEGTKEGDDKGVPPVSQRGEEVMTSGLLGHACEATSASRPARPGGRPGPAVGARGVWGQAEPTPLIGPAREGRPVLARPMGCVRGPAKWGG